jgi:hypothetical protein
MAPLKEVEGHRIEVPSRDESRYRQLAGAAKRFRRVPELDHIPRGLLAGVNLNDPDAFECGIVTQPVDQLVPISGMSVPSLIQLRPHRNQSDAITDIYGLIWISLERCSCDHACLSEEWKAHPGVWSQFSRWGAEAAQQPRPSCVRAGVS